MPTNNPENTPSVDNGQVPTPKPIAVTLDRVEAIMREFGITLAVSENQGESAAVASANLNGVQVMFALLDSVLSTLR